MDELKLAKYISYENVTEQQVLIELKKFRHYVSQRISEQVLRRMIMYGKRQRDLRQHRLNKGFQVCLDYINQKIEQGEI